ncbi:PrgI family protein [Actinoplanes sp. NPDC049668]|uniref:PrgI family protein n=1 Tax=unclassified Actinoplanes TaxID=2626549 RepID=UPI0033A9F42E
MEADTGVRARIPADVEAPDRLIWNLTARQVAILATAATTAYLLWQAIGSRLPLPVFAAAVVPLVGVAAALAVGRRDGLPLDLWLWAAIRYRRSPRRQMPAPDGITAAPLWAPAADSPEGTQPQVLRLPAHTVGDDGVISLGDGSAVVLVAATTVNIGLRTGAEQAAMVAGYARWLNSLTGPVQVVVSAQRVDLTGHAQRVADAAQALPDAALADAAMDYAHFLAEVAQRRDPLWRTVTIACRATGPHPAAEAMRRAVHTATALAALGSQTRVLDGPAALAVLTAAVDPYAGGDASWPRATPHTPITAPPIRESP